MSLKTFFFKLGALIFTLLFVVVISFYMIAGQTGFKGRRGGPQDAFRHTYSSAVVARYISPKAVHLVTILFERNPESIHNQMDINNNNLGVQIGLSSKSIYREVHKLVEGAGPESIDGKSLIVLPKEHWSDGF